MMGDMRIFSMNLAAPSVITSSTMKREHVTVRRCPILAVQEGLSPRQFIFSKCVNRRSLKL